MPQVKVDLETLDLRNAAGAPVTGRHVRTLQGLLNVWLRSFDTPAHQNPVPLLDLDGVAGTLTRETTVDFQSARRLDADAVVGPLTWTALVEQAG